MTTSNEADSEGDEAVHRETDASSPPITPKEFNRRWGHYLRFPTPEWSTTGTRKPAVLTWAVMALLLYADHATFQVLGFDYFHWYVNNGSLIAIIFAVISASTNLDRDHKKLISMHPSEYLGECFTLVGLTFIALSDSFHSDHSGGGAATKRAMYPSGPFELLDVLTAFGIAIALLVLSVAWILVVAPIQYLVNLVCGAPSRLALSGRKTWMRTQGGVTAITTARGSDVTPPESFDIGIRTKPVTFTNIVAAVALWATSLAI